MKNLHSPLNSYLCFSWYLCTFFWISGNHDICEWIIAIHVWEGKGKLYVINSSSEFGIVCIILHHHTRLNNSEELESKSVYINLSLFFVLDSCKADLSDFTRDRKRSFIEIQARSLSTIDWFPPLFCMNFTHFSNLFICRPL